MISNGSARGSYSRGKQGVNQTARGGAKEKISVVFISPNEKATRRSGRAAASCLECRDAHNRAQVLQSVADDTLPA
jgi:hypothetical protein